MKDLAEFKKWRSARPREMRELEFACPDDMFIFIRMNMNINGEEGKYVLYAEDTKEAKWFIQHIFLYDIMNDTADDLELDFKKPFDEKQKDAIILLKFWYELSKRDDTNFKDLYDFCERFNSVFACREGIEYEIGVLNGADELQSFLNKKYSDCEKFDMNKFSEICSKKSFSGKLIKDFLDNALNNKSSL